jgi:hypothetical protein
MKPQSIRPAEETWRFDAADRFVDFARSNQLEVVGHCLVWAKDDRTDAWMKLENGEPVSRETLLRRIEEQGHIAGWPGFVIREFDAYPSGERLKAMVLPLVMPNPPFSVRMSDRCFDGDLNEFSVALDDFDVTWDTAYD